MPQVARYHGTRYQICAWICSHRDKILFRIFAKCRCPIFSTSLRHEYAACRNLGVAIRIHGSAHPFGHFSEGPSRPSFAVSRFFSIGGGQSVFSECGRRSRFVFALSADRVLPLHAPRSCLSQFWNRP